MQIRRVPFALFVIGALLAAGTLAALALSPAQQTFRDELAGKVAALEKKHLAVFAGSDGWLFLTSELRFLAQGPFWGEAAAKISRSHKAQNADPIPAIADFNRQLKERGIALIVVPIPAKAAIYPDKLGLQSTLAPTDTAPYLQDFYGELGKRGIEFVDLTGTFASHLNDPHGALYCRTDSHWSGNGCYVASEAIAQAIRDVLPGLPPKNAYFPEWKEVTINGDLVQLLGGGQKVAPEKLIIRQLTAAAQPDPNSPVLLMGDSHTLVFHEFLAERAGLLDQLAAELKYAPDLIGTRGSGATAVRVSFYRRARSEPDFLAKKKLVVWCFAARELTEADQGWVVQPIAK
ncbi:MAG: hypothetical protein M3Y86_07860 [Verrucomicrobiota bacterium]|nr:hypothetical protein [Verrucomicrobiota bacterium]